MKISFIIPAFNAQETLSKCLDSIFLQPFSDFEVILVNDGSTDSTQQIAEEYQARDSRLKIIFQANAGQGAARSNALEKAQGEYVWFVDSDDWLLPSVLARLTRILSQQHPDVLLVNFEYAYDDKPALPSSLVPSAISGRLIDPLQSADTFAAVSCWNTPPWRLISNRQHLLENNIQFAKGVFYEDHPFAIHLMLTARRVYVDAGISYAYYQRPSSTTKTNDSKVFDFLEVRRLCLELFRRFDAYEKLTPSVTTYILPVGFYQAHVTAENRQEFVERLGADVTEEELEFAEAHGDWVSKAFARAIRARNYSVMDRLIRLRRLRNRCSRDGAERFIRRLKGALVRRLVIGVKKIKNLILRQVNHSGFDSGGNKFLHTGIGTRLEPIYVDVRVNIEQRPYVIVGDYSLVGGSYIFERGIGTITIGSKTSIGGGTQIVCTQEAGIHIGNHVMLSWGCTLMDSNSHSLNPDVRKNDAYDWKVGVEAGRMGAFKDWSQVQSAPIFIEDDVWVGFETAILKGVTIGKGAVVGSRSLVTKNIPPYTIYAGTPAKFIGLVPRDRWEWGEIIHALQGDPESQQMLKDAYLHKDLYASLLRYQSSAEFSYTLAELRKHAPGAKKILDVGGGGGVMSVALALEGYEVTLSEPCGDDIVGAKAARVLTEHVQKHVDPTINSRMRVSHTMLEDFEPHGLYDVVFCRQVVHHFSDPVTALRTIHGLLSVDGVSMLVREHVIYDTDDKENFLQGHPFQKYSGGENAYRADEYVSFLELAGFRLLQQYRFAESPINYFPHSEETARTIDEAKIAGRPYSFIARKVGVTE
ncbi:glycosyltransferase [Pseudomonas abietaniphila]|uniref:Transferase hexapeptide (Six repeat-containing protein) n=1 Tax=Pseudomonas abietaniphila TaxID=89065 RepID=A0A1G8BSV4_9PSED|nr:glycosyltransferase [Pseudomonas abietaniphila]SDH36356.1 transferase hexapeptide (six repeat-containing protein) [Pseudomonas abietaniphila]